MRQPGHNVPKGDLLPTFCWCGRWVRKVPAADVRAGRTVSCHRKDCRPPEATP